MILSIFKTSLGRPGSMYLHSWWEAGAFTSISGYATVPGGSPISSFPQAHGYWHSAHDVGPRPHPARGVISHPLGEF